MREKVGGSGPSRIDLNLLLRPPQKNHPMLRAQPIQRFCRKRPSKGWVQVRLKGLHPIMTRTVRRERLSQLKYPSAETPPLYASAREVERALSLVLRRSPEGRSPADPERRAGDGRAPLVWVWADLASSLRAHRSPADAARWADAAETVVLESLGKRSGVFAVRHPPCPRGTQPSPLCIELHCTSSFSATIEAAAPPLHGPPLAMRIHLPVRLDTLGRTGILARVRHAMVAAVVDAPP